MGQNSGIEWTHHTFNPWWGCTKLTAACKFCYAETWARRTGNEIWGERLPRRFFGATHWRQPVLWNRRAAETGERQRVFCASMADVFEDRPELVEHRMRLFRVIETTPNLDWLLLTKRPENVLGMTDWSDWPANVWLGATVENQDCAIARLDALVKLPAAVRFLSCEPLLSALDLQPWAGKIDWIIAGGESGGKARPTAPEWFRQVRDFCIVNKIYFHFKQWGRWMPLEQSSLISQKSRAIVTVKSGADLIAVGKKLAGRNLDGRTWDQLPTSERPKRGTSVRAATGGPEG